jgi:hypothetical protein
MALTEIPIELSSTPSIVDGGNATAITIDSSENVGIGTSSPSALMHLKATNNAYTGGFRLEGTDETSALAITHINGDNYFSGNATDDHLVLTGTGNVGIGNSSPSALSWPNGSSGGLFLQAGALLSAYNAGTNLSQNWYYNGGEKYIANGPASRYSQNGAEHVWYSAGNNTSGAGAGLSWQESMRISSAGEVTMPSQPAFLVQPASLQNNIPINANTTIAFGTEVFDQGGNFASNVFTAPVTGRYQLNVNLYAQVVDSAAAYVQVSLRTTLRQYYYIFSTASLDQDALYMSFPISVLAIMDASDTAHVEIQLDNTGAAQMDINSVSSFSGYLVA